jgi:hypothetical protein
MINVKCLGCGERPAFYKCAGVPVKGGKPWFRETADVPFGFQSAPGKSSSL